MERMYPVTDYKQGGVTVQSHVHISEDVDLKFFLIGEVMAGDLSPLLTLGKDCSTKDPKPSEHQE